MTTETTNRASTMDQWALNGVTTTDAEPFRPALIMDSLGDALVPLSTPLSSAAGTMSFWIKPQRDGSASSQTYLTARWSGTDHSYLAISHGWWEPAGAGVLYFIASNQDKAHCERRLDLYDGAWTMLTVTWQSGTGGFCRLYVNNLLQAQTGPAALRPDRTCAALRVGSDAGATDQRGRHARGLLAELLVLDVPITAQQVEGRYRTLLDDPAQYAHRFERELNLILSQCSPPAALARVEGIPQEVRAVFDEAETWVVSQADTDRVLAKAAAAGFNRYIPCVWHGGGAYFPTDRMHMHPLAQRRMDAGDDPLRYLLDRAAALGLTVHPWFTVTKRKDAAHPQFYEPGVPAGAYDIHNDAFRAHMADFIAEAAGRYGFAGVNLDYIRTMGTNQSLRAQEEYRLLFGRDLLTDATTQDRGERVPTLHGWKSAAVTDAVTRVRAALDAVRPGILLSVDAVPGTYQAYAEGQDAIAWANAGKIDRIYSMDYTDSVDLARARAVCAGLTDPARFTPLLSTYRLADPEQLSEEERACVQQYIGASALILRPSEALDTYAQASRVLWPGSGLGLYSLQLLSVAQGEHLAATAYRD